MMGANINMGENINIMGANINMGTNINIININAIGANINIMAHDSWVPILASRVPILT